mgnify:FL=1
MPASFAASRLRQRTGQFVEIHGGHRTRLYRIWMKLRSRCRNPNETKWPIYGGRGIRVDPTWEDFSVFALWATTNGYRSDLQIDRIDVDGDYTPDNCRFVTPQVNSNNRRNNNRLLAFGETKTVAEWARDPRCVVSAWCLYRRIKLGCVPEHALTLPLRAGFQPQASS